MIALLYIYTYLGTRWFINRAYIVIITVIIVVIMIVIIINTNISSIYMYIHTHIAYVGFLYPESQ